MTGRKALAVAALVVGVPGVGGAWAATHGTSHHANVKPAAQHRFISNIHYPCRHHHDTASLTASL
jgi:hypothetical protein